MIVATSLARSGWLAAHVASDAPVEVPITTTLSPIARPMAIASA